MATNAAMPTVMKRDPIVISLICNFEKRNLSRLISRYLLCPEPPVCGLDCTDEIFDGAGLVVSELSAAVPCLAIAIGGECGAIPQFTVSPCSPMYDITDWPEELSVYAPGGRFEIA